MNIHGIELSDFPESVDVEKYPYQMIVKEESDGETAYRALLTSKPIYYNPTSKIYEIDEPYDFVLVALYEENPSEVVSQGNSENVDGNVLLGVMTLAASIVTAHWVNFDVLNNDTGEIHLKSYDGVLLPPLPSDIDRTVYPYAYVARAYMSEYDVTTHMFMVADTPMKQNSNDYYILAGTKGVIGLIDTTFDAWENVAEMGEVTTDTLLTDALQADGVTLTVIWSEAAEEKLYEIKESTLKAIANAIRAKTGKTELIPPENMPGEIDGISSSGGGIENGHNVMFYDENSEELAFYSIKQGHSIEAPIYTCKAWQTEDGTSVSFPYTPIGDLVVYANNDSYASTLYGFYNIDPVTYPYLLIEVLNSNLYIYFAKTILRALAHYLEFQTGYKGYVSVSHGLTDFSDIASVVSAITQHIPTLTYQSSSFAAGSGENKYEYSNFDTNRTDPVPLGSYHLDE